MLVEQLMSCPAVTCRTSDPLGRAAQLLWDHDVGSLPVVDATGRLVGMITDRDICMAAYLRGQPLSDIAVDQAMAKQVFACSPGDPIGVAERIMARFQIRRVPVSDSSGHVVGVLSLTDLAREAQQESGHRLRQVTDGEVSQTLAAVCRPRRDQEEEDAEPEAAPLP